MDSDRPTKSDEPGGPAIIGNHVRLPGRGDLYTWLSAEKVNELYEQAAHVAARYREGEDVGTAIKALSWTLGDGEQSTGLDDQHCPTCLSFNICQQTREDQEPWGCLDCADEFEEPLEPATVQADALTIGCAVKAPRADAWSKIQQAVERDQPIEGKVLVRLSWGCIVYDAREDVQALT